MLDIYVAMIACFGQLAKSFYILHYDYLMVHSGYFHHLIFVYIVIHVHIMI